MSAAYRLGLVGALINTLDRTTLTTEETPQLLQYLENVGIGEVTKENLQRQLWGALSTIEREFDYYDSSELKVNELLNQYFVDLWNTVNNGIYPPVRDVSMTVCALGNKGGDFAEDEGVECFIKAGQDIIKRYEDRLEFDELPDQSTEVYLADSRKLEYFLKVLSVIDVFVTSRFGAMAGVEEYAPVDYNYLHPIDLEMTDWVGGLECNQQEDCQCGCTVDHSLKLLEGMEDYLEGNLQTEPAIYFEGVARANGIRLDLLEGNEGPVWDAVKNLANEAWKAITAAWEAVKDWFSDPEEEKKKNEATVEKADDNKKAIQSMEDKSATINDAAAAGIKALAEKTDPTGGMSKIVLRLTGPASAPGVIDGLLGELEKHSSGGAELQEEKKAAETALADLKKATSVSGDDDNKEAAATAKAGVKEKIKAARESVKKVKQTISEHNKITKGIRKAIEGITPHIFVTPDKTAAGQEENKNEGKKGKKKK